MGFGKTHKLHSTKVRSAFVATPTRRDAAWCEVEEICQRSEMMGDLQIVKDSTGPGALGMMHKQAKSVGCLSHGRNIQLAALPPQLAPLDDGRPEPEEYVFSDVLALGNVDPPHDVPPEEGAYEGDGVGQLIKTCLNLFATTTDGGSDEAAARRLKVVLSKDYAMHLEFPSDCFAHIAQHLFFFILTQLEWLYKTVLGQDKKCWSSVANKFNVARLGEHCLSVLRCRIWCHGSKDRESPSSSTSTVDQLE